MSHLSTARASLVRSLHRKKGRLEEGAFLAEGERLLDELAQSTATVRFLFATADRISWMEERFPRMIVHEITARQRDLFATEHAQGVGAVVERPEPPSLGALAASGGPILYLDRLADPGNAGTIVRTAEWFSLSGVVLGEGSVDLYNPKTVRSTMGAIFRFPIAEGVAVDELLELGLPIHALDAGGGIVLGREELPRHAIYAVGSEAHGVTPDLLARARTIAIAGGDAGESLNASVAAAILCYELSLIHERP